MKTIFNRILPLRLLITDDYIVVRCITQKNGEAITNWRNEYGRSTCDRQTETDGA